MTPTANRSPNAALRLAILVPRFPVSTQAFTYVRARALARAGVSVGIFDTEPGDDALRGTPLLRSLFDAGVTERPLSRPRRRPFAALSLGSRLLFGRGRLASLSLYRAHRRRGLSVRRSLGLLRRVHPLLAWRAGIVHVETSFLAPTVVEALRVSRIPVLVSLRGADVDERPAQDPEWRAWLSSSGGFGNLAFHAVSEHVRLRAEALGVPASRIVTIPQGIEPSDFEPAPPIPSRIVATGRPPSGLLLVARLSKEKGVDVAIRGLAALRSRGVAVDLSIVGDGPERPVLSRLVSDLGLEDRVAFLGERSPDDVRALLLASRGTRIAVQPSRFEAFGQSVLEAMAAGLPVVAARVGGLPELVVNGETGLLFEPSSPAAFADAVEALLSDRARAARMGEAGRRRAFERFPSAQEAESFVTLFRTLRAARSGGAPSLGADPKRMGPPGFRAIRDGFAAWRRRREFPVLLPHVRIEGGSIATPGVPPSPAPPRLLDALRRCDGKTPLREVARAAGVAGRVLLEQREAGNLLLWPRRVPESPPDEPADAEWIVLSPHPDDAALSVGGWLLSRGADPAGSPPLVVVAFSRTAWTRWRGAGLSPDEVTRLREAEERLAARLFGYAVVFLGLPEAPLRGRAGVEPCGAPKDERDDEAAQALGAEVRRIAGRHPRATWILPLGVGAHLDHLLARDVALSVLATAPAPPGIELFVDLPYAAREGAEAEPVRVLPGRAVEPVPVRVADVVGAKVEACRAHGSQFSPTRLDVLASYAARHGGRIEESRFRLLPRGGPSGGAGGA